MQASEETGIPVDMLEESIIGNPSLTEDCLFLDVYVPVDIINSSKSGSRAEEEVRNMAAVTDFVPVAVMLWIHGGGYIGGERFPVHY